MVIGHALAKAKTSKIGLLKDEHSSLFKGEER
jgi:hypothetical protein